MNPTLLVTLLHNKINELVSSKVNEDEYMLCFYKYFIKPTETQEQEKYDIGSDVIFLMYLIKRINNSFRISKGDTISDSEYIYYPTFFDKEEYIKVIYEKEIICYAEKYTLKEIKYVINKKEKRMCFE